MAIGSTIVIDVGGAAVTVEVQVSGFARTPRRGTQVKDALGGNLLVTQLYGEKQEFPPYTTGPLTTNQLVALKAAAQYPKTIVVGGEALRTTDANTSPQTINAKVLIESEDYLSVGGSDFYHIAHISIRQAD